MKKLAAIILPLMLVCGLVLAACGKNPGGTNNSSAPSGPVTTIYMNGSLFTDSSGATIHSATVKANTPITFSDIVQGGGTHFICVGKTGSTGGSPDCESSGNGPSQLYSAGSGLQIMPGSKTPITFPNTGSYHVICTVHGGMYVDVTVTS